MAVEPRPHPFRPWAPEIHALLASSQFSHTASPQLTHTARGLGAAPWYFAVSLRGAAIKLNRNGTTTLVMVYGEVKQYGFPALQQAYLTGCLLLPEAFPPLGH